MDNINEINEHKNSKIGKDGRIIRNKSFELSEEDKKLKEEEDKKAREWDEERIRRRDKERQKQLDLDSEEAEKRRKELLKKFKQD